MKVAVTAKGAGLGGWLDPVFEESRRIVLVDEGDRFVSWSIDETDDADPHGDTRIRWLTRMGAGSLVTGRLGEAARTALRAAGISVFVVDEGSVLGLVEAVRTDALKMRA